MHAPVAAAGPSRPRILIVDDEPYLVALCERTLRRHYDVSTFTDARMAADAAITGDFDLVISNMNMPHLTGHQLFNRVCAARPAMTDRFLFLTGGVSMTGDRAFDRQLARALTKPFRPAELLACVQERLEGARARGA